MSSLIIKSNQILLATLLNTLNMLNRYHDIPPNHERNTILSVSAVSHVAQVKMCLNTKEQYLTNLEKSFFFNTLENFFISIWSEHAWNNIFSSLTDNYTRNSIISLITGQDICQYALLVSKEEKRRFYFRIFININIQENVDVLFCAYPLSIFVIFFNHLRANSCLIIIMHD